MKNLSSKSNRFSSYPSILTDLPKAELPIANAKGWILQAEASQLVFFEFESGTKLPEHNHAYPQWGIVIAGKMELTVDGKLLTCEKGDEYLIPAGAKHFVRFLAKTRVMDYFSEKNRYKHKTP